MLLQAPGLALRRRQSTTRTRRLRILAELLWELRLCTCMSRSLWCVMNGLAVAPPGIMFIIGVSTYRADRCMRLPPGRAMVRLRAAAFQRQIGPVCLSVRPSLAPIHPSVFLSVCLSVPPPLGPIHPSVSLSVGLSVPPPLGPIHPSVSLSVGLSVPLPLGPIHPSVSLSVGLSVAPPLGPIHPSVSLPACLPACQERGCHHRSVYWQTSHQRKQLPDYLEGFPPSSLTTASVLVK
jgi:hypothetical protein